MKKVFFLAALFCVATLFAAGCKKCSDAPQPTPATLSGNWRKVVDSGATNALAFPSGEGANLFQRRAAGLVRIQSGIKTASWSEVGASTLWWKENAPALLQVHMDELSHTDSILEVRRVGLMPVSFEVYAVRPLNGGWLVGNDTFLYQPKISGSLTPEMAHGANRDYYLDRTYGDDAGRQFTFVWLAIQR